jgi:hypothetical protein
MIRKLFLWTTALVVGVNLAKAADFPPAGHYATGKVNTNILNHFEGHRTEMGHAVDTGGTVYVHFLSGNGYASSAQDFTGGTRGAATIFDISGPAPTDKAALAKYRERTFAAEINDVHGFRTYYNTHGSIAAFGPPRENEHHISRGTRQDFAAMALEWDSATRAITAIPLK